MKVKWKKWSERSEKLAPIPFPTHSYLEDRTACLNLAAFLSLKEAQGASPPQPHCCSSSQAQQVGFVTSPAWHRTLAMATVSPATQWRMRKPKGLGDGLRRSQQETFPGSHVKLPELSKDFLLRTGIEIQPSRRTEREEKERQPRVPQTQSDRVTPTSQSICRVRIKGDSFFPAVGSS